MIKFRELIEQFVDPDKIFFLFSIRNVFKSPNGRCSFDEVLQKLLNGYRLPCPEGFGKVTTWLPQEFYSKLSKICYIVEPRDRASFSDVVEVIEKELTKDELDKYIQENKNYEQTKADVFCRLSILN